ncbi:hypothetical protein N431DRAFT_434585 [Stipitochalara longipes BDJ]|nr:hypothetical protein N431DRAFT_434585 [Stipitochalara longipes BDJ]
MIRQTSPDQPQQRPSQAGEVLDQEDQENLYMEESDDGNWSDPPSESNAVPERRTAATRNFNPRRHERSRPAQNLSRTRHASYTTVNSNANSPAYSGYNTGAITGAGGQAVPYGEHRNPFLPINNPPPENRAPPLHPFPQMAPGPPTQPNVGPAHGYPSASRHPRPAPPFPSRTYPADAYESNDPWYPRNYAQGGPYAPPMDSHPPGRYPYPGEPYFGNPQPPASQHAPYAAVPRPWPTQPTITHTTPEYPLDEDWRERDEGKADRHESRRQKQELQKQEQQKQELEKLRAEKKQAEAAERKRKEIERIKKHAERKAKVEVYERLQREGTFRDSDARSDPGRTRLAYDTSAFPALTRQMQDTMVYLDDKRDREPDLALEEIAQVLENRRRPGGGRSYGGSVKSSLDGASPQRGEVTPRVFYDAKTDPDFRNQVKEVVMDLLRNLNMNENEEDRLPLPPVPVRAASDEYPAGEGHRRIQHKQSDPSRPKMPPTPPLSQEAIYPYEDREAPQQSTRSTDRRERRPPPLRKSEEYSRNSQPTRNDTRVPDNYQPAGPQIDAAGYTSTKHAHNGIMRDRVNNTHFDGQTGQQISNENMEGQERTQGRMYNQAKLKVRRGFGHQQAFKGILSSSESEEGGLRARGSPREPAPYAYHRDYPLPSVPDAPFSH